MIKLLVIKNLILVAEAKILFEKGLTVITGETGAGKTALIEALRLILGERCDASKIRKGCEKALVQASFSLENPARINPLFEEAGLSIPENEDLIISREFTGSGKSRSFISGQMVPAAFLRILSPHLMDFIGQHAHVALKSSENQRSLLDLYSGINLQPFQALWKEEKALQESLDSLSKKKETSAKLKQELEEKLETLLEASIQEGEEEKHFEEYSLLANSQELLEFTDEILSGTDDIGSKCFHFGSLIEKMRKYDNSLEEAKDLLKEAHLQIDELRLRLQSFAAKMECDPNRLLYLEERLSQIETLKKIHGKDLITSQKRLLEELEGIENLEETIQGIRKTLSSKKEETTKACQKLTERRQIEANKLASFLSSSLQKLNVKGAIVEIRITPTKRTLSGEDQIDFYLKANIGEEAVLVKDSSSGGELSRLLFSLKIALAEKSKPQTMIFDEIDANVGGETASIIGKKLQKLGEIRQVICITHFPQVARHGDHHLRVYKEEIDGRTTSKVESLKQTSKETELLRMLGGQSFAKSP